MNLRKLYDLAYFLYRWALLRVGFFSTFLRSRWFAFRDFFVPPERRSFPARVGVLTCTLNEAACIAFTIGALIDKVDLYVHIDTGSTDGTEELVRTLYRQQIESGKLVVVQLGALKNYAISVARNEGLRILREHNVDYVIKADGDDVFYDEGATALVKAARWASPNTRTLYCGSHELYQWEAEEPTEWLQALFSEKNIFWNMGFRPIHGRVFPVEGTTARGCWTDEAYGKGPEGLFCTRGELVRGTVRAYAAHYGWAKPVRLKRIKSRIWNRSHRLDPRVETLQNVRDWRRPLFRFRGHPQVIARKIVEVLAFFEHRNAKADKEL